ncbi:MAG TPA: hypothetical protein VL588_06830, partial [Bdellovibrionota bacterium]|nr:hypothetical protein [Bdellovibrionota bacterium]
FRPFDDYNPEDPFTRERHGATAVDQTYGAAVAEEGPTHSVSATAMSSNDLRDALRGEIQARLHTDRHVLLDVVQKVHPPAQCSNNSCTAGPPGQAAPSLEPYTHALSVCEGLHDAALRANLDEAGTQLATNAALIGVPVPPGTTGQTQVTGHDAAVTPVQPAPVAPGGHGGAVGGG